MATVWIHNPVSNRLYAAKRSLASGGQAIVFDGLADGAPVAIKVIRESSNFLRDHHVWDAEKNVYQRCSGHPHIVAIIDHFISSTNNLVIVMERAEGTAQQLIERGVSYSAKQVCLIGIQLASALQHVHSAGVIHRDVTLRNVLRFPGGVFKLGDFGISRADLLPGELARTMVAAPGYLPPELLQGGSFTPQSDIYQLGLVLLSLLLGRHPISPLNVNGGILGAEPRLAAERAVAIHGPTASIIQWMLPRTPARRIQTAAQVRSAFQAEYDRLVAAERAAAIPRLPAPGIPSLQALARDRLAVPARPSAAALARKGIRGLPPVLANPSSPWLAANGIGVLNPLPKLPEGKQLAARSKVQGIGLLAPPQIPPQNGLGLLGGGLSPLGAMVRDSALAAKGIGLEPQPAANAPLPFGFGLGQTPQVPPPPANEQVGGLLALSSLAAFASGKVPLGIGLGALGTLALLANKSNATP